MAITQFQYVGGATPRQTGEFTIVAQDPGLTDDAGRLVTANVRIPYERLEPGPRSHRFHVVNYDASTRTFKPPVETVSNILPPGNLTDIRADNGFHAQNVFVIATRTLTTFESALGRRIEWGYDGHQLHVVPHALAEANAFYSDSDRALLFGYFESEEGTIFTCLAHDVVAHETTHAVLDGIRPRYDSAPGLPDQAAFHEAFADIVALLSAFSLPNVTAYLLGKADRQGVIASTHVTEQRLGDVFTTMAEQLGKSLYGRSVLGLRNSLERARAYTNDRGGWRSITEPHSRGEIFVAAVMHSLVAMWNARLQALVINGKLNRDRAAEEGASVADHLLKMCIRALDYCPPLEFEFEDFLDALLVSDAELEPDDLYNYRGLLRDAFAGLDIRQPKTTIVDFGHAMDGKQAGAGFDYDGFNYVRLRSDPDELYRFMWQNREVLELKLQYYTHVEHVRTVTRIGSDGFVVTDVMADYVQEIEGRRADLEKAGLPLPPSVPSDVDLKLWGGGVIVFDQFGRVKYHQFKPLGDLERQARRLAYLVSSEQTDTRGRFGFADGSPRGMRYAELHRSLARPEEVW